LKNSARFSSPFQLYFRLSDELKALSDLILQITYLEGKFGRDLMTSFAENIQKACAEDLALDTLAPATRYVNVISLL